MRDSLKTSATIAGTCTFIAHVSGTSPVAPNLRPAMKTTLAALGRFSSAKRSSRSAEIGSTAAFSSASFTPGSLKRATPITRLVGAARLAIRASVGPILPPTPRTRISPGVPARSATSSADGAVMKSSTASTLSKRAGRLALISCLQDGPASAVRVARRASTGAPRSRARRRPRNPDTLKISMPARRREP